MHNYNSAQRCSSEKGVSDTSPCLPVWVCALAKMNAMLLSRRQSSFNHHHTCTACVVAPAGICDLVLDQTSLDKPLLQVRALQQDSFPQLQRSERARRHGAQELGAAVAGLSSQYFNLQGVSARWQQRVSDQVTV